MPLKSLLQKLPQDSSKSGVGWDMIDSMKCGKEYYT